MVNIKVDVCFADAVSKVVKAASEKKLVLFIGAGVSRNADYPDWKTLLTPAVKEMGDWDDFNGESLQKVASIYQNHCGGDREPLRELLDSSLGPKRDLSKVHLALPGLQPCLIATTNYDRLLETTFPAARLVASPLAVARLKKDELGILHLHGHLDHSDGNHDGLILTETDYAQVATLKAPFFERLRRHWQDSLILFLGYGSGDWDVAGAAATVRASYGEAFAKRHLAIDLSGRKAAVLQAYWAPFNADVVPSSELDGDNPGDKLFYFLNACILKLGGESPSGTATPPPGDSPPCPPGHSLARIALWDSLFASQQAGWGSLQATGLVALFKTTPADWAALVTLDSPKEFFDFCTAPAVPGDELLFWLLEVLCRAERARIGEKKPLPPEVQKVCVALCSTGIEQWVEQAAIGVPWPMPEPAGWIRLASDDPWVIYLMAVAMFKCKSSLEPGGDSAPRSLIYVNAPSEDINKSSLVPVESAINAFFQGHKAVTSKDYPGRGHRHSKIMLEQKMRELGSRPIFNVNVADIGNSLLIEEVRQQVFARYNIHTVLSGDPDKCTPEFKEFANLLAELIKDLNAHLYPNAPRPENPS